VAVEGAIKILNDLPRASEITLTNFPRYAAGYNYAAAAQNLFDLKSVTLPLLLEQMGLAPPTRNIFDLRQFDPILMSTDEYTWPTGTIPNLVIERNFDPETLQPSHSVNGNNFVGMAGYYLSNTWDIDEYTIDPGNDSYDSAVADWRNADWFYPYTQPKLGMLGVFFSGLTGDDVGALRYLLSTNTVQLEPLLSGVHGAGTNASSFVNVALRPGVEKITFVRHQYDSLLNSYIPLTNQYTDTYVSNNVVMHQSLQRIVTHPDFLFSAGELNAGYGIARGYTRTGTSNWWNSAKIAGTTNAGPGVIRPQVKITYCKRGPFVQSYDDNFLGDFEDLRWASFDGSVAAPVLYPETNSFAGADTLQIHLNLLHTDYRSQTVWQIPVAFGGQALLQTSTDLMNWASVTNVVNHGGAVDWDFWYPRQRQRFFRAVPQ
jgi:hypothetical protein